MSIEYPIEYPIDNGNVKIGGEVVDLPAVEPILARVLRARVEDSELVILHTDDGGKVGGRATEMSEDGTIVTVVEGRDQFEVDVTKIVVIETLRRR